MIPNHLAGSGFTFLRNRLLVALTRPFAGILTLNADEAGVRVQVERTEDAWRVGWLDLDGATLGIEAAPCVCHPLLRPETDIPTVSVLAANIGGARLPCAEATADLVLTLLASAREHEPRGYILADALGMPKSTVNDLTEALGRPRSGAITVGVHRVLVLADAEPLQFSAAFSQPVDRPGPRTPIGAQRSAPAAGAPELMTLAQLMQKMLVSDAQAQLKRESRRTKRTTHERPAPRWRGWPVPSACPRVRRALLQLLDDQPDLDRAEFVRRALECACDAHADWDVTALTEDSKQISESAGRFRLTTAGKTELYRLTEGSRPFTPHVATGVPDLRTWQGEALQAWIGHGRRGVIEAVTGTGKTRLGLEAIADAIAAGGKAVVCVPGAELLHQWVQELRTFGLWNVGLIGDGHRDRPERHDVIVGTVHSLRKARIPSHSTHEWLLVADECHRYGATSFQDALDPDYVWRLGLTATFERNDDADADLAAFFESSPVFTMSYDRAVPEHIVANYVVMLVGVDFTPDERVAYSEADLQCKEARRELLNAGLPEKFGPFMEAAASIAKKDSDPLQRTAKEYLAAFSRRAQILGDAQGKTEGVRVLAPVVEAAHGALFFSRRVASSKRAAELLKSCGISALSIDGSDSRDARAFALNALRRGRIQALCAPQILDEGIDVPDADLAVVIATTKTRRQMIQRMGRVLRLKADGRQARFVLLYVRDTAEDPHGPEKAHEAFFNMITDYADAVESFHIDEVDAIRNFALGLPPRTTVPAA